jgi:glycine oxidase
VSICGAGVAGLACALELAERDASVEVLERNATLAGGCSWFAGGMLAPWCELESCGPLIAQLGEESLPWWRRHFPDTVRNGTLVVAHGRDLPELRQFAQRTGHCRVLDAGAIGELEPDLAGRFAHGLLFADEAHLDPRAALTALAGRLRERGVTLRFAAEAGAARRGAARLDCSGLAARAALPQLRGVKGEMLLLRQGELHLSRPVRVLHPRLPVYVVPRGAGVYLVGATMLESEGAQVSARSLMELLGAAYALHPAFGEAEVLELGSGLRPAFPDNQPRLSWCGGTLYVNGLYRHGFLIAPALAQRAARVLQDGAHFPEVMGEDPGQRRLA